jgi:murein DD-endopeptidase MepM/ murein hydrolase activator NlpD
MFWGVGLLRSHKRALALAAVAVSVAGCGADSTRFGDGPYAARPGNEVTGSVSPGQSAPVGRVETSRLAPPGGPSEQPMHSADVGVAGGSRGVSNYHPPQPASPEVTGTVQAPVRKLPPPQPQWTWDGGTAVIVAQGESVEMIARRHNVPASAVLQANGLASPAILYPGQRLVIPRKTAAVAAPPAPALATKPAPALASVPSAPTAAVSTGQQNVHVVAHGDTLSKISRQYHKSVDAIARANNMQPQAKLNIGDRLVIPGARAAAAAPVAEPLKDAPKEAKDVKPAVPALSTAKTNPKQAANNPTVPVESAAMVTPAADPAPTNSTKGAQAAAPTFRWPVHGKVIAGFGPRPNGQQNDGINVAVPENTPVKAAEDGVVAYAGSELKGYGNLVLVRHSNGYVTAYAHAKELMVKRGDNVKRGQVIAKSGQTGAVDAPQLHFEVRKGPSPQDPMPMLSGG